MSSSGSYNTETVEGSVGGLNSSIAVRSSGGKIMLTSFPGSLEGSIQDCAVSETDFGGGNDRGLVCSTIRVYANKYVEGGIWYWDLRQNRWIQIYKSTSLLPGRLALFPNDTLLVTAVEAGSPDFGPGAPAAAGIYRAEIRRRKCVAFRDNRRIAV